MTPHILSLPAELLSQILTSLPLSSLLHFSETCHPARTLANANLQSLSLGISPLPSPYTSFPPSKPPLSPSQTHTSQPTTRPHDRWLRIPNITTYDYTTLSNFQSALLTSILTRHHPLLSHVDLTIWTMSVRMAHALRNLSALQRLELRFDAGNPGRAVLRAQIGLEREEQRRAWDVLARSTPSWSRRLLGLRVEGAVCLNLYDCEEELAPGTMEKWNAEVWRIPHFVAPRPSAFGVDMVIEVDPEYVS
ncbi:hypothetical protein BM1_00282 [Bipolaris maydis]|nr:hypothetical protein BM1_00282 [Bipolaris maydis]